MLSQFAKEIDAIGLLFDGVYKPCVAIRDTHYPSEVCFPGRLSGGWVPLLFAFHQLVTLDVYHTCYGFVALASQPKRVGGVGTSLVSAAEKSPELRAGVMTLLRWIAMGGPSPEKIVQWATTKANPSFYSARMSESNWELHRNQLVEHCDKLLEPPNFTLEQPPEQRSSKLVALLEEIGSSAWEPLKLHRVIMEHDLKRGDADERLRILRLSPDLTKRHTGVPNADLFSICEGIAMGYSVVIRGLLQHTQKELVMPQRKTLLLERDVMRWV